MGSFSKATFHRGSHETLIISVSRQRFDTFAWSTAIDIEQTCENLFIFLGEEWEVCIYTKGKLYKPYCFAISLFLPSSVRYCWRCSFVSSDFPFEEILLIYFKVFNGEKVDEKVLVAGIKLRGWNDIDRKDAGRMINIESWNSGNIQNGVMPREAKLYREVTKASVILRSELIYVAW